MKKMTTTIKDKNGKDKHIAVLLEDELARLLEETNDEYLIHQYIVEEYKSALIERKETRRHQSLERDMENGKDFMGEDIDVERDAIKNIEKEKLHKAIADLSEEQIVLLTRRYVKGEKVTAIAKDLGIDKTSVRDRLKTIYKKIKKFL